MKKVIVALHGLKPTKYDDLSSFKKYSQGKLEKELIAFEYFHNNTKTDLNLKAMLAKIEPVIDKEIAAGNEVTLFGYSMGTLLSLILADKYLDIKNVVLLTPANAVDFLTLYKGLHELNKRAKSRLSKQEYNEVIKNLKDEEKYRINKWPKKLLFIFYNIQKNANSMLKNLEGKNIYIIQASKDEIIENDKVLKILERIDSTKNHKHVIKLETGHFFNQMNPEHFDLIIDTLNKV